MHVYTYPRQRPTVLNRTVLGQMSQVSIQNRTRRCEERDPNPRIESRFDRNTHLSPFGPVCVCACVCLRARAYTFQNTMRQRERVCEYLVWCPCQERRPRYTGVCILLQYLVWCPCQKRRRRYTGRSRMARKTCLEKYSKVSALVLLLYKPPIRSISENVHLERARCTCPPFGSWRPGFRVLV